MGAACECPERRESTRGISRGNVRPKESGNRARQRRHGPRHDREGRRSRENTPTVIPPRPRVRHPVHDSTSAGQELRALRHSERVRVRDALEKLGGIASRSELLAMRVYPDGIQIGVNYGSILRVRKGWYASVGTPRPVLRALRVGGRLACVSALAQYESPDGSRDDETAELHVLVKRGASRLRIPAGERIVIHWTRRDPEGSRTMVSEQVARQQAATCRKPPTEAAAGRAQR